MQNVNSGNIPFQPTGYITPAAAINNPSGLPATSLAGAVPTLGLSAGQDSPEQAVSQNPGPVADRTVHCAARDIPRSEIRGGPGGTGGSSSAGSAEQKEPDISAIQTELMVMLKRLNIPAMKEELMALLRPLLSMAEVWALGTSGWETGKLALIVTVDSNCSQPKREQVRAGVESFLEQHVPRWLRDEFQLRIKYSEPITLGACDSCRPNSDHFN